MTGKKRFETKTGTHTRRTEITSSSPLQWCWLPVLLTGGLLLSATDAAASDTPPTAVDYAIVVTGGELLAGAYPDGHTYFLTRTLRPLGLRCVGSMSVDDRPADIQQALRFATGKAALVIVTGGLGPTDNDVTRKTLSEFTGIALREHPEVLKKMERRFNVPRDKIRPNLRRQTRVPVGGGYLKNSQGTAVGLVFEREKGVIVALPGPPRELQPMVRDGLVPYLSRRFGTRLPGCSLLLRFVGIGQSGIDQTMKQHVPLPADITTSSQFKGMRVDFTFSLPDDTPQNRKRLDELKREILKHLGEHIYGDDETSLEQHVMKLLAAKGATLALAEVGSGGTLAAGLNGSEDSRQILAGAYVAPTEAKLRRLLRVPDADWTNCASSAERTRLLAATASRSTGSQWTVAVGEVQREGNSAGYVEVVFKQPQGDPESQRVKLQGGGELAHSRLNTWLLDQLRRRLK